jgi:hypothetical protein
MLALVFLLDLGANGRPELRSRFDFRPEAAHGDVNEDITVWMSVFSANLRALPFADTLYLANPWGYYEGKAGARTYSLYATHPPLLTAALAALDRLAGPPPLVARRLAIFLFALRVFFLFGLCAASFGPWIARGAVALYLLTPATQQYTHSLLFEVAGGTLALGAYWALARSEAAAAVLGTLAVGTEWVCLLFLPLLARRFRSRRLAWGFLAAGIAVFGAELAWLAHFPTERSSLPFLGARLVAYLSGPSSLSGARLWHQLAGSFPWFILAPAAAEALLARRELAQPVWVDFTIAGAAFLLLFFPAFLPHAYLSSLLILPMLPAAALGWARLLRRSRPLAVVGLALLLATAWVGRRYPWKSPASVAAIRDFNDELARVAEIVGDRSYFVVKPESVLAPDPVDFVLRRGLRTWSATMPFGGERRPAAFNLVYLPSLEAYGIPPLPAYAQRLLRERPACREPLFSGRFLLLVRGTCLAGVPGSTPEYYLPR